MALKTKSEKFVEERQELWRRLKMIISKISHAGHTALREDEIRDFPRLYRLVCEDLAEAKLLQLSHDVIDYLNSIVGLAHKYLYSFPPLRKSGLKIFFSDLLPGILVKYWGYLFISGLLFFGTYAVFYSLVKDDPNLAHSIIQEEVIKGMEESYKKGITENRDTGMNSFAVSFYIHNNISIAFFCFASGILFGLGSVYFLVYNGIVIGTIAGYVIGKGYGDNFINFVTAHSVLELIGIAIAGAAGLLLGYSIIRATRYFRLEWLNKMKSDIFTLIAASAILIFLAALIEGFVSPSLLPYHVKFSVALISAILIVLYFIVTPVIKRTRTK